MTANKLVPIIPLRDVIFFPDMTAPLFIGRRQSISAVKKASLCENVVLAVAQKESHEDFPSQDDIYKVGCLIQINQTLYLSDGTIRLLVSSLCRVKITKIEKDEDDVLLGSYSVLKDRQISKASEAKCMAFMKTMLSQIEERIRLGRVYTQELLSHLKSVHEITPFINIIAVHFIESVQDKQMLLEENSPLSRMKIIVKAFEEDLVQLQIEKRVRSRVRKQMEKMQKEHYLNEQMRAIQKELGQDDENISDVIYKQIQKSMMPSEYKKKALSELNRMKQMHSSSMELSIIRNYLDVLLSLPWKREKQLQVDIGVSKEVIDKSNFGMLQLKDRVLDYISAFNYSPSSPPPAFCFVGPPGTGKTSITKAIAKATGRDFINIQMGGVSDECEVRGHRRTYIASMPGKIIQSMRGLKYINPLIILDEIDKVHNSYKGDPFSALLSALDPQQNQEFIDHYLEVGYDLSRVMFVCTANTLDIPYPLRDRMEIIEVSGYSDREKESIAKDYIIPSLYSEYKVKKSTLTFDDGVFPFIITRYTRESGVRSLKQGIRRCFLKYIRKISEGSLTGNFFVTKNDVESFLGKPIYYSRRAVSVPGVANAVAWSQTGGSILFVESVLVQGGGDNKITGNLQSVMEESVQVALSYVLSRVNDFQITEVLKSRSIHVHFSEGATPKDGPSAGAAICVSILSILSNTAPVSGVAITGEVSLSGSILPVGGIKEKVLAACREGMTTMVLPKENVRDVDDFKEDIPKNFSIVYVSNIDDVFSVCFGSQCFKRDLKKKTLDSVNYMSENQGSVLCSENAEGIVSSVVEQLVYTQ